jgi:hypothetical protein
MTHRGVEIWLAAPDHSTIWKLVVSYPPGTFQIGGWVSPRSGLVAVEKKKIFAPSGNRTQIPQPSKTLAYS